MFEPDLTVQQTVPGTLPDPEEERLRQQAALAEARRRMAINPTNAPAVAQPPQAEQEPEEDDRGFFRKMFASTSRGALEAVDETVDFLAVGKDVNLFADAEEGEEGLLFNLPKAPQGIGWGLVEGFTQFGVGMVGAGKFLKVTGVGRKVAIGTTRFLRGSRTIRAAQSVPVVRHIATSKTIARMVPVEMASAITDATAFDPYDDRMVDLFSSMTGGRSDYIFGFMNADEDTPEIVARAQAALEGGLLGVALGVTMEGIVRGLQISRIRRQMDKGRMTPDEAQRAAMQVSGAPLEDLDLIRLMHNEDGTLTGRVKQRGEFTTLAYDFIQQAYEGLVDALPGVRSEIKNWDPEVDEFMYHATASKGGIMDLGLKPGREVSGDPSVLGGGGSGVSLTWSKQKAEAIAHYARNAAQLAKGIFDLNPGRVLKTFEANHYENPILDGDVFGHRMLEGAMDTESADLIMGLNEADFGDWVMREYGEVMEYADAPDEIKADFDFFTDDSAEAIIDRFDRIVPEYVGRTFGPDEAVKAQRKIMAEIFIGLDSAQKNDIYHTFSDFEGDEWLETMAKINPDDVGVVQVALRKDANWKTRKNPEGDVGLSLFDSELEISVWGKAGLAADALEVVERLDVASEAQAAALNLLMQMRTFTPADLPAGKIREAVKRISKMINEADGEPDWDTISNDLGLNLSLFIKDYEDFTQISRVITKELGAEMKGARQRAGDGYDVSTWEATYQRALGALGDMLGMGQRLGDVEAWARGDLRPDAPADEVAHRVQAAALMLNYLGQDISKLSKATYHAADGSPERAMLGATLQKATQVFADIQIRMAGMQSQVGRTLNTFKLRGMSPAEYQQALRNQQEKLIKGGIAPDEMAGMMDPAELDVLAKSLMLTNGNPEEIRKVFMHMAGLFKDGKYTTKASRFNMINRFRTGMMLYGPKTHDINILNNALVSVYLPFEHITAGLMTGDKVLMRYGIDQYSGMVQHLNDSFMGAFRAFKTGENILAPQSRMDEGLFTPQPGSLGVLARMFNGFVDLPGRALMSADEFFKQSNYFGYMKAKVMEQVRDEAVQAGLTGAERQAYIANKVSDLMSNLTVSKELSQITKLPEGAALNPEGMNYAAYATFTNELTGWAKGVQDLANKHPSLRFLMPFIRTPINLIRFSMERTPGLALFMDHHRQMIKNGGRDAQVALAREGLGMAVWGTGGVLYMGGKLTGNGPSDPEYRKQWMAAGNQPYSVKVGNHWISYARMEPLATAFGILADFYETLNEYDDGQLETGSEAEEAALAAITSVMANASQKTFILGLTDFLAAVSEDDSRKTQQLINNVTTSFSPNFLSQMNQDPHMREARGFVESLKRRTFWGMESRENEPRRNILGEPVMKPVGTAGRGFLAETANAVNHTLNPFTVSYVDPEKMALQRELLELGQRMPMPQPTRLDGNIDLRDRERYGKEGDPNRQSPYDRMLEIVSNPPDEGIPSLRVALERLVGSQDWDQLSGGTEQFPGGSKYDVASRMVQQYYRYAYVKVREEFPKLKSDFIELSIAEAQSKDPSSTLQKLR